MWLRTLVNKLHIATDVVSRRAGYGWRLGHSWIARHDPVPPVIRWLLRHRGILAILVGLSFIAMLPFPDARWAAIVTLWGIIGAGLVVSAILEEHGDDIKQRYWLKRESRQIYPFLEQVFQRSRLLAFESGVPVQATNDLIDRCRERQLEALRLARTEVAANLSPQGEVCLLRYFLSSTVIQNMLLRVNELAGLAAQNGPLLSRLTELHGRMRHLDQIGRMLIGVLRSSNMYDEVCLIMLREMAGATLDVCECCLDLFAVMQDY